MGHTPTSSFPTTDDAVKLFVPGHKILLKPFDDSPEVSFTILKLSTPVTKSVAVLATPDAGAPDQVVIKINDPRYLEDRISSVPSTQSYPWEFAYEQAAAMARAENSNLSYDDLRDRRYARERDELSGDDLVTHCLFWEEHYHRLLMEAYETELEAYRRLEALQGSVIPRLIMTGKFLAPDERAIQPPALVLEYIPSVSLYDVPPEAITPAIRTELLSTIARFHPYGVIHNDLNLSNIRFTPPDNPVKAILIDFALAAFSERSEEEAWAELVEDEMWWAQRLLEKTEDIKRPCDRARIGRFM